MCPQFLPAQFRVPSPARTDRENGSRLHIRRSDTRCAQRNGKNAREIPPQRVSRGEAVGTRQRRAGPRRRRDSRGTCCQTCNKASTRAVLYGTPESFACLTPRSSIVRPAEGHRSSAQAFRKACSEAPDNNSPDQDELALPILGDGSTRLYSRLSRSERPKPTRPAARVGRERACDSRAHSHMSQIRLELANLRSGAPGGRPELLLLRQRNRSLPVTRGSRSDASRNGR